MGAWLPLLLLSFPAWAQTRTASPILLVATESSPPSVPNAAPPAEATPETGAEPVPATRAEPPEGGSHGSESEVATADPWNLQLGMGLGQQYAGVGASVSAYARVAQVSSLGAFASVGLSKVEPCCSQWGYAAGVLAAWGREDRVALALSYGAVWNEDDIIDYGITAAAGYEMLSRRGFWLRWLAGVAVSTDTERDVIPTINLGLGWNL